MSTNFTGNGYSGLAPQRGWPGRNAKFLRHHIVPGMFRKLGGSILEPVLTPPMDDCVRITWIGHASFFLQFAGNSVVVDPNWAKWHGPVKRQRHPGLRLGDVPEVDLVLVTHAHFDHLHKPSLKVLQASEGIVVPKGSASLVRKLGFPAVHEVRIWDELEIRGMNVIHTPCHHWGARYVHDTHRDYGLHHRCASLGPGPGQPACGIIRRARSNLTAVGARGKGVRLWPCRPVLVYSL